jgi:microcystin-dependent protein
MKHHLRLLAAFAVVLLGFAPLVPAQTVAGAPTTIDYQGKALDSVGSPLANTTPTNFEMRFRIYDAQEGGTVIWSEKQVVTVSKGLFSVRLGEGTALSPAEGSVAQTALADAFAATARFLGVTIVISGQTPTEILPRLAFLATPYAFVASKSVSAERLLLNPSATAPASALSLSQINYVTQEISANALTLNDQARTYLVNPASASHLVVNLPGAITSRREYSVMKKDNFFATVTVQVPVGGSLNGVVNGIVRLKVRGEGVVVQNTGNNDWWIISDTRDRTPPGTIVAYGSNGDTAPPGWAWCNGTSQARTDVNYVDLFAAIGTVWGTANATSFTLPDLRGLMLRGKDANRGQDPDRNSRTASAAGSATGDSVGSFQDFAVQTHAHAFSGSGTTAAAGNHNHGVNANQHDANYFGADVWGLVTRSRTGSGDVTPNGGDSGGRGIEQAVFMQPQGIPYSGDHTHSFSFSSTTSAAGGNETRPKNVSVNYIIKL